MRSKRVLLIEIKYKASVFAWWGLLQMWHGVRFIWQSWTLLDKIRLNWNRVHIDFYLY